jgi:hypothetical protein
MFLALQTWAPAIRAGKGPAIIRNAVGVPASLIGNSPDDPHRAGSWHRHRRHSTSTGRLYRLSGQVPRDNASDFSHHVAEGVGRLAGEFIAFDQHVKCKSDRDISFRPPAHSDKVHWVDQ